MGAAKRATRDDAQAVVDAAAQLEQARAELADAARRDPAVFCQFVLRDEETGGPIELCRMHEEWHDLISGHKRIVIWTHTEAGKTQQISIGRVLWELGRNPRLRVLVLCEATSQAEKIVKSIRNYIEQSAELHLVFPHLQRGNMWREDAITIKRDGIDPKDPSVMAAGFEHKSILGSRYDLIIIDDYLSAVNTATELLREKSHGWLKSTIEGRKTRNCRLVFIGNAWHKSDAMHRYATESQTVWRKFSVLDEQGRPRFPTLWSLERYHEEYENRGPVEAERSLNCNAPDEGTQWFSEEDVLGALRAGNELSLVHALEYTPEGYTIVTGVDLAVKPKEAADWTAFATVSIAPRNRGSRRRLLDITAEKIHGPRIIERLVNIQSRYQSMIFVETNGAQDYLRQFALAAHPDMVIRAFQTGRNRVNPTFGIQSLAVEMKNGLWEIPNDGGTLTGRMHREVRLMLGELLKWSPEAHTGDRAQALWIAREGARELKAITVERGHARRRP